MNQELTKEQKRQPKTGEKSGEDKKLNKEKDAAKNSTNINEEPMPATPMLRSNKTREDSEGSQIALYEPQSEILIREVLESTSLINESTKLLHSQTKSLLRIPEDQEGVRKVDHYNMEQARANMNTLAKLIQTKVNLFKVVKQK